MSAAVVGVGAKSSLRPIGHPDAIANIVVFLASNDLRSLTGEQIIGSGGIR